MRRIPLIGSHDDLCGRVEAAMAGCQFEPPAVLPLSDLDEAVDYLNVELPDILFMHFSREKTDAYALLDTIKSDPWLVHGGIVALCDDDDAVERLEQVRDANLIVILPPESLERQLPRMLDIIHANPRILFQREIGANLIPGIAGHFKLNNDPLEARCYTNLVCNFLFYSNRVDAAARDALSLGLYEILVNAIEHGNCGISHEEKTEWLRTHTSLAGLIAERQRIPEIARKKVVLEYTITPETSRFFIADEGQGFDWRNTAKATDAENLLKAHGRGIMMARAVTQDLTFNEKGNEVQFDIPHQADQASLTPALFEGMAPRDFAAGEQVFEEGDPGNFLYYIAKGRFEVLVGGRKVAELSPEDIFLGEMSFLLNNRRSASVRAGIDGRLIEISKRDLTGAIREHPHYALLLSRLLAQRIDRANRAYRG